EMTRERRERHGQHDDVCRAEQLRQYLHAVYSGARDRRHALDVHPERPELVCQATTDGAVADEQGALACELLEELVTPGVLCLTLGERGQMLFHGKDHRQRPLRDRRVAGAPRAAYGHPWRNPWEQPLRTS